MERSDQKQATASYVLNLYEYVESLNHNYAQYNNTLLYFESKYGNDIDLNDESKKMTSEELESIHNLVAQIRHYIVQSYMHIRTIYENHKVDFKGYKELQKQYNEIKKTYIIKRDDVENFCFLVNSFMMQEFMISILQSSNEIINQIYNE